MKLARSLGKLRGQTKHHFLNNRASLEQKTREKFYIPPPFLYIHRFYQRPSYFEQSIYTTLLKKNNHLACWRIFFAISIFPTIVLGDSCWRHHARAKSHCVNRWIAK